MSDDFLDFIFPVQYHDRRAGQADLPLVMADEAVNARKDLKHLELEIRVCAASSLLK